MTVDVYTQTNALSLARFELDQSKQRIAKLESDLCQVLRAVLHHFGPEGQKLVTDHVLRPTTVDLGEVRLSDGYRYTIDADGKAIKHPD